MKVKTKCNYNCFEKQSHIDTCTQAFLDFKRFGFEFRDFGFGGSHVHFPVNIPKKYFIQTTETMLKSYSRRKMFEAHPDSVNAPLVAAHAPRMISIWIKESVSLPRNGEELARNRC